jgi:hypothetical protein
MSYRVKAIETYEKIDSLLNIKNTELPLQLLGKVNAKEIKEYLGTYQFKREKGGLLKIYVKNNILYSDYSYGESNVTRTFRNYKISDNIYLSRGLIWKFNRDTLGEMGIEYMNDTGELTKKE